MHGEPIGPRDDMNRTIKAFNVSELYSNEEIYQALAVGNAGGVRVNTDSSSVVNRIAVFTSIPTPRQLAENPYHDRLEADVLTYTGAGRAGDQSVSGVNARLAQQQDRPFPIFGFMQIGSRRDRSIGTRRWRFIGLLQYLRCYPEHQVDAAGKLRTVWLFELRVHADPVVVPLKLAPQLMRELYRKHLNEVSAEESELTSSATFVDERSKPDLAVLEPIRRQLLGYDPRHFEHVIHDLLRQSGFDHVEVTKYSQDGGIDINARPGPRTWPLRHLLVQLQAKRWLHTVGRKEVAELRGSLQPHAAGCIVTTSHFSRAALLESVEPGKVPIAAIDGHELAAIVHSLSLVLP